MLESSSLPGFTTNNMNYYLAGSSIGGSNVRWGLERLYKNLSPQVGWGFGAPDFRILIWELVVIYGPTVTSVGK